MSDIENAVEYVYYRFNAETLASLVYCVVASIPDDAHCAKINRIKKLRELTGIGLVWAKELVEACEPRDPVVAVAARIIANTNPR